MYATHVDSSSADVLAVAAPHAPGHLMHGRFELAEHLHRSSRADTYRATDLGSGDTVVLKCLRADAGSDGRARRRIEREARSLRRVRHPNIVRVHAWHAEPASIVLEHVVGITLRGYLRDRRVLDLADVVAIGLGLCDALACVHAHSLVHVDIKPANVMLKRAAADPHCRIAPLDIVLIDFDLARAPGTVGGGLGTRLFASPEQTRGGTITGSADVWGLGVLLYRAASGRLPFTARTGSPQVDVRASSLRDDPQVAPPVADLIDAMLHPTATMRPRVARVRDRLADLI